MAGGLISSETPHLFRVGILAVESLVRKERQAWEVTGPVGRDPSESALRQTWPVRSGKSGRARLVWWCYRSAGPAAAALVGLSSRVSAVRVKGGCVSLGP